MVRGVERMRPAAGLRTMDTSLPSRSFRRPLVSASLLVATAATLLATHGCSSDAAKSEPSTLPPFTGVAAGAAGAGPVAASGGTGGALTAPAAAGSSSAGEGNISGAPLDNGMATSGGTAVPPPCVDVEPPPDPEWPDATCATWAAETEECAAAWFQSYCDVSCGR